MVAVATDRPERGEEEVMAGRMAAPRQLEIQPTPSEQSHPGTVRPQAQLNPRPVKLQYHTPNDGQAGLTCIHLGIYSICKVMTIIMVTEVICGGVVSLYVNNQMTNFNRTSDRPGPSQQPGLSVPSCPPRAATPPTARHGLPATDCPPWAVRHRAVRPGLSIPSCPPRNARPGMPTPGCCHRFSLISSLYASQIFTLIFRFDSTSGAVDKDIMSDSLPV